MYITIEVELFCTVGNVRQIKSEEKVSSRSFQGSAALTEKARSPFFKLDLGTAEE